MKTRRSLLPRLRGQVKLQRRSRPGFTLLEAVVTITMAAILISGGIMFVIGAQEQMHIYQQIRLADEWAYWYMDQYAMRMRNGEQFELTRIAPPSRLLVTTIAPEDVLGPEDPYGFEPTYVDWQFEYSPALQLPVIRKGRNIQRQDFFPPQGNPRDNFRVPNREFEIKIFEHYQNDPTVSQSLRENTMTLEFSLEYSRSGPIGDDTQGNVYKKTLDYETTAYVTNTRWEGGGGNNGSGNGGGGQ